MNGERKSMLFYTALAAGVAIATVAVMLLFQNITERKVESRFTSVPVVTITEEVVDPAEWGKNFPSEYDSYKRTVDVQRTRHGGSEAFQKLDDDPRWRVIFAGYPFGIDYREERGHAYMLQDQRDTERVKQFKQPGACLHCHASVTNAYIKVGLENGAPAGAANREAQLMKGFELVNKMPYAEATQLVEHPVACIDCHEPVSMKLRVTRPGFLNGIRALAASADPVPHFPSIESWRKDGRKGEYDPNALAGRQEMRSFVCGQCHVEYYFKPPDKYLTYPWHNGLKMEQAEAYYDEVGWKDWVHKENGAPVLKAQHPEFELWSQGIHARSGVTCVDCHMPYVREGARKVTDHQVRSPMLNEARACQVCHRRTEQEIKARVEEIQDRTKALMIRAEEATVAAIGAIAAAQAAGAGDDRLAEAELDGLPRPAGGGADPGRGDRLRAAGRAGGVPAGRHRGAARAEGGAGAVGGRGRALGLTRGLRQRLFEQRRQPGPPGTALQVAPVEPAGLHAEHAEHVAPLAVGNALSLPEPRQLLKDHVLGRGDPEGPSRIGRDHDLLATLQLVMVELARRGHEYVRLEQGGKVDHVEVTTPANRRADRVGVRVEVGSQRVHELRDERLAEVSDEIDVHRGAGLPVQRARERTAQRVGHAERLENGRDAQRDRERVGDHQYPSTAGSHPKSRIISSRGRRRAASRRRSSSSVAWGWRARIPARLSSWAVRVIADTSASFSAGVLARQPATRTASASGEVS